LVARPAPNGFRVIDAFSRITRLGEGVTASGQLSEAAMSRTIDALKVCARKMIRRQATQLRAVATEACRRASNCDAFLARVKRETGIDLEIITNSEEAGLALHGCAPLFDRDVPHAVIFDIGGGSTEVSWLEVSPRAPGRPVPGEVMAASKADRLVDWHSIPIGVVTLSEHHGGDAYSPETYEAMVAEVTAALRPFEDRHEISGLVDEGRLQMLGTSGTVTTLAGVDMGLPRYDRSKVDGCFLDFQTIRAISGDLAGRDWSGRAEIPCIGRERADLVVAGCAILEALCRLWPVGRLRVADRGLREGILYNLMRDRPHGGDGLDLEAAQ
jgi:exopolyphosphatase/guanosine-5'-triphosphate,3'-diphosphate pyrophosphatase